MFGKATRDLKWGIQEIRYPPPQVKRFRAFCVLKNDTFASSDGKHVTLWTPKHLIKVLELPALAMHYIKSISHIVAFCHGTSQLIFAQAQQPYFITKHPQLFSNKIITTMHYFERAGVLVCAGQGLMFSRLVIPQIFKSAVANPEMLKIEKIVEHYNDILFTSLKAPVFVNSREIVLVYNDNHVWVHNSDGDCVQKVLSFTKLPISCVSYYDEDRKLVAGDEGGNCAILEFEVKEPFKKYAVQDPCRAIGHRMAAHSQLLYVGIYNSGFLLAISLDKHVTLTHLKTSTTVQSWKSPIDAIMIRQSENQVLLFSVNEVVGYKLNIFTNFFCDLETDASFLQRCPSSSRAARLLMFNNHSVLTLMSPKTIATHFAVRSSCYKHDIKEIIYSRDIVRDGAAWRISECGDLAFLLMTNSTIVVVDFGEVNDPSDIPDTDEETGPLSSITSMKSAFLKTSEIQVPLTSIFAAFVRVETEKYPGCVIGICRTGHCNMFSGIEMKLIEKFWLGFPNVMCAAFSSKLKCLVIVGEKQIVLYNVDLKRVEVELEETNYYTCLMVIDDNRLACGCANGELEVRNLPTLKIISSSQQYNAYHTDGGTRRALTEDEMSDPRELRKVPFSVRYIDYCAPREAILTISPLGEVIIWDLDAFPLVHLDIDIHPTAVCFQNGHGSLLVAALNTIFVVDWKEMFCEQLVICDTELDDFDLLDDTFSLDMFHQRSTSSISSMNKTGRFKRIAARARIRRVEIDSSDEEFFDGKLHKKKEEENVGDFNDLITLQNEIPKGHYLDPRARGDLPNPRRKFIPPPMPPLIHVELIEKKESIEERLMKQKDSPPSKSSSKSKSKKSKTAGGKSVKSSDKGTKTKSSPSTERLGDDDDHQSRTVKLSSDPLAIDPHSTGKAKKAKIIGGERLRPKSKSKSSRSQKSLSHSRQEASHAALASSRRDSREAAFLSDQNAADSHFRGGAINFSHTDASESTAEKSVRMPSPRSDGMRSTAPRRMTYHSIEPESTAMYKLATDERTDDDDEFNEDNTVDNSERIVRPNPRVSRRMSFMASTYNPARSVSMKTLPSFSGPVINITCYGPKREFTNHFSEYIDSRRSSKVTVCENESTGSKSLKLLPTPDIIT